MTKLTLFSVRNRALVALTTLFAVFAGLWSATALPRELFPSLEFPVLAIVTPVPGASAAVVEERVSAPMEFAAQRLSGVVEVTSTSSDGFSAVTIELDYGTDVGNAQTDLQRSVLSVQGLPEGAEPEVFAGSIDDFPIVQLSATGGEDAGDLVRRLEELVVPDIEDIDGVRGVQLTGVADRIVRIDLDEETALAAGVDAGTVAQLLQANGVVLDAGTVLDGSTELPVQVGSRLTSAEDIAALPLAPTAPPGRAGATGDPALPEGADPATAPEDTDAAAEPDTAATLGDVAEVELAEREPTAYTRTNGEPSVGMQVTKTPDGNAVEVSRALEQLTPELEESLVGGELVVVFDQAPFIEQSIEDLTTEGILGLGFAILVVLVFLLSVRLTLVTAVSIPLSLLVALLGLQVFGYSLNIFTLGALTISVGRVVDDSIVVIENIKRHLALGEDRMTSIVNAVREVAGAITSATAATVAVFLPLGLVGGQVGELFRPFAFTVAIAMLGSLLVALTIVPVLGYWFVGRSGGASAHDVERADEPDRLQRAYLPVLRGSLAHPVVTLVLAGLVLVATGAGATQLKTDFIGSAGEDTLTATLEMPAGTRLDDTDAAAQDVEAWLADRDDVESYQVVVGSTGGIEAVFLGGGSSTATFAVTLAEDTDGDAFGEQMQESVELPEDGRLTLAASTQQPGASNLEVVVSAADPEDLAAAAEQVVEAVREVGGADVTNNLSETVPSLSVTVDREAAADAGLTETQVGQLVSAVSTGSTVGQADLGTEILPVVVEQGEAPETLEELAALVVGAGPEGPVELGDIAALEAVESQVQVTRIDGQRSAVVTASPTGDNLGALTDDLTEALEDLDLAEGVRAEIGGVSADQQAAFASLGLALLAAIAIVYLVMVATFNSLLQPVLLMVSVPFAATGSVAMLLLTDTPLDVAALFGLLLLVGIVVTNAIVLIDLVNQWRSRGVSVHDAVVEGSRRRFRPIVMTALATIGALSPLALSVTGGGAFISQPLALVVIGGLISSTALTLILVPVLYQLTERGKERLHERRVARRGRHEAVPEDEVVPETV
ncbi:efflux RND transporter permease subunit [Ornithinimicrobium sediminis]|uniref:efflux RND transporter permease subunit n=1 Tax=Ornithinimicrobium sediminis TaxID=2904603 RepID=UPI001E5DCA0E|nr:efflux RND transporter permease subunit [Ornithinimicrobium sediminis]MCE0487205.1 efflux RND transporter permease subunit [Ornithinimicrobium sediminis]